MDLTFDLDKIDNEWYGILLEILLFGYCFIGLAIICDDFLVPSLETLCVRWRVREDVAGASFMAFGSAAPEIIVNIISTLKASGDGASPQTINLGVGAIMGSSLIAFSLIPGACAFFGECEGDMELKRRPLFRDIAFYSVALISLILSIDDGAVQLKETVLLLLMYVLYGLIVFFSPMIRYYYRHKYLLKPIETRTSFVLQREAVQRERTKKLNSFNSSGNNETDSFTTSFSNRKTNHVAFADIDEDEAEMQALADSFNKSSTYATNGLGKPLIVDDDEEEEEEEEWGKRKQQQQENGEEEDVSRQLLQNDNDNYEQQPLAANSPSSNSVQLRGDEVYHVRLSVASDGDVLHHVDDNDGTRIGNFLYFLATPMVFLFNLTCPHCERGTRYEYLYPLTFGMSFIWVAFFSYVISTIVERWGILTNVPLSFFGFFLVAVGAEIPDMIQSVTVARRGYGSMSIANCIGSQICNICVGLGLPWTLAILSGQSIVVTDAKHIEIASYLLFVNLTIVWILYFVPVLLYNQPKVLLTKSKGKLMIIAYFAIVTTYSIIIFTFF